MAQKSASIAALPRAGDMQRKRARIAYLSLLPVLLILLFVKAYPILATIYRSFTNWDGLYKNDFVGLANYKEFFGSGLFMTLFKNNLVLLLVEAHYGFVKSDALGAFVAYTDLS